MSNNDRDRNNAASASTNRVSKRGASSQQQNYEPDIKKPRTRLTAFKENKRSCLRSEPKKFHVSLETVEKKKKKSRNAAPARQQTNNVPTASDEPLLPATSSVVVPNAETSMLVSNILERENIVVDEETVRHDEFFQIPEDADTNNMPTATVAPLPPATLVAVVSNTETSISERENFVLDKEPLHEEFSQLPDDVDTILKNAWDPSLKKEETITKLAKLQLNREELRRLNGKSWLSGIIIDFYLDLICRRNNKDTKYPKTFAFSTFFYTGLSNTGYARAQLYTRKIDIFSFENLLIPINVNRNHWIVCVVNTRQKFIHVYDSLRGNNSSVVTNIREYLNTEHGFKKGKEFDFSGWDMRQVQDGPLQRNDYDCGVFSCQTAEWLSRNKTPTFTEENMPYYRKRMAYEIMNKQLLSRI